MTMEEQNALEQLVSKLVLLPLEDWEEKIVNDVGNRIGWSDTVYYLKNDKALSTKFDWLRIWINYWCGTYGAMQVSVGGDVERFSDETLLPYLYKLRTFHSNVHSNNWASRLSDLAGT